MNIQKQHYPDLGSEIRKLNLRLGWKDYELGLEINEGKTLVSKIINGHMGREAEQKFVGKILQKIELLPEERSFFELYKQWCVDREDGWINEKWENYWYSRQSQYQTLEQEYLQWIITRYSNLDLGGLAPEVIEGPYDVRLSQVYIDLPLQSGVNSLTKFKTIAIETPESSSAPSPSDEAFDDAPQFIHKPIEENNDDKDQQDESQPHTSIWQAVAQRKCILIGKPGAGKSTTLKYLALALANEENTTVDKLHGCIPILVKLADFARRLQREPDLTLSSYLCIPPEGKEFQTFLEWVIENDRGIILFDELDIVRNPQEVINKIKDFVARYGNNHVVIATREATIQQTHIGMGFEEVTLRLMNNDHIQALIDRWYTTRNETSTAPNNQTGSQLIGELEKNPPLMELTRNPLMLTIIVLMYWRSSVVPNSPIEVYRVATDTLLNYWPKHQNRAGISRLKLRTVKRVLQSVAYNMLQTDGLISEDQLLKALAEGLEHTPSIRNPQHAQAAAEAWLEVISQQSGFLINQGPDNRGQTIFGFFHQQLGEYLAAGYLAECGEEGIQEPIDFVFSQIHLSQWTEVFLLFIQQLGLISIVKPTRAIRKLLTLHSPWEETVWRDHLLAGRCLGMDVAVAPEIYEQILDTLLILITNPNIQLRNHAADIVIQLKTTEYQDIAIQRLLELAPQEWPWYIQFNIARCLVELGERQEGKQMLTELRDLTLRRDPHETPVNVINLLLKEWPEETLDWFLEVAGKYNGRGITIDLSEDPEKIAIHAADYSFCNILLNKFVSKEKLQKFTEQLRQILTLPWEQARLQWITAPYHDSLTEQISKLTNEKDQILQFFAAKWLAMNGKHDEGIQILSRLATQGVETLEIMKLLDRMEEYEHVDHIAQAIIAKSLDPNAVYHATRSSKNLGKDKITKILVLISGLLYDQNANGAHYIADTLLKTPAREVGLAALSAYAASLDYKKRYEATICLQQADQIDEAYQTLIDIALRWESSDRVKAVLALSDPIFQHKLKQDDHEVAHIAGQVVSETSNKYSTVTTFLQANIIPSTLNEAENTSESDPTLTSEQWQQLKQSAWQACYVLIKEWLNTLPEISKSNPHAQAIQAILMMEDKQEEQAIIYWENLIIHPQAPALLLLNIGEKLFDLNQRQAGKESFKRVSNRSNNPIQGWLTVAEKAIKFNEHDLANEAIQEVITADITFMERRQIAHLLCQLGRLKDGITLLLKDIDKEVPNRINWLKAVDNKAAQRLCIELANRLIEHNSQDIHALITKADALHKSNDYDSALEAIDQVLEKDPKYSDAWRLKSKIFKNQLDMQGAISAMDEAIRLSPSEHSYWCEKTYLMEQIGSYQHMLESLDKSYNLAQQCPTTLREKGNTLASQGELKQAMIWFDRAYSIDHNLNNQIAKAQILRRLHLYEEALSIVETVLDKNRRNCCVWVAKAEIFDSVGAISEALDLLETILHDEDPRIQINAIFGLFQIGGSEAIDLLIPIVNTHNLHLAVRLNAILALSELRAKKASKELMTALEDSHPAIRAKAIYALGELECEEAQEGLLRAIKSLDDANTEDRRIATQYLGMFANQATIDLLVKLITSGDKIMATSAAFSLAMSGDEQALEILQPKIRPEIDSWLYNRRGILLRRLGYLEEALQAHNQAIKIDEDESLFWGWRGDTYLSQGNYLKAKADFKQSLLLNPNYTLSRDGLAIALFELDHYHQALHLAHKVKENHMDKYVLLACNLWQANERHEALRLWRHEVAKEPRLKTKLDYAKKEWGWGSKIIAVAQELNQEMEKQQTSS